MNTQFMEEEIQKAYDMGLITLADSMIYDNFVQLIWNNMEDVPFDENPDGELVLSVPYFIWDTGTSRFEIWDWFDGHFSKGVMALVF